jgi:hypothetical protein
MNRSNAYLRLMDQLVYNSTSAPDEYPDEDQTNLEAELRKLRTWAEELLRGTTHEVEVQYLGRALQQFEEARAHALRGDGKACRASFREAEELLKRAKARKAPKVTFVVGPGGEARQVTPSDGDDQDKRSKN